MLPTKFRFIWPSGFRGEDILEINQSETRMAYGGYGFFNRSGNIAFFPQSLFSSPCQRQSELLSSLVIRRLSSVNFSHFNLFL
jgi:hypothetical protein